MAGVNLKTGRFDHIDSAVIISSVSKTVQNSRLCFFSEDLFIKYYREFLRIKNHLLAKVRRKLLEKSAKLLLNRTSTVKENLCTSPF